MRIAPALLSALLCLLGSPAPAAEPPFDYFRNSWTVIGLKDYPNGTRIGPDQDLLLGGGVRAAALLGSARRPIPRTIVKTLRDGWLPVVEWVVGGARGLRYRVEAFAAPMPGGDPRARYAWPVDGDNYLSVVRVAAPVRAGAGAVAALRMGGNRGVIPLRWEAAGPGVSRGVADGRTWAVASRRAGRAVFWLPFTPLEDDAAVVRRAGEDPLAMQTLAATTGWWRGLLARGAALDVPERKALDTYRASLVYQFIGRTRGEVHAGKGFYDAFFLRDGSYQQWSLALAGYLREARESIDCYPRYQKPDGQFVSQEGQLDAHGYALWAIAEHYWLTRDRAWLRSMVPAVRKAVAWLQAAREQGTREDPRYAGLLPAAPADGENLWGGRNHIVGYDFWALRGLVCAQDIARVLGEAADAARWSAMERDYRAAIEAGLRRAGKPYIPPTFEGVGTHWGNLESLFPTLLFAAADRRVAATLDEVRRRFGGGFLEGCIRWSPGSVAAIHPYMTQFVTNDALVRGDQRTALEGFYGFLLHTTATQGFPEGVYYTTRTAWGDTVPHLWAAGLYCITLRNMLVRELGDELHLSSALPPAWLAPGRTVRIARAPTRFGVAGATWQAANDRVTVRIAPPRRNPPRRIVIHLPLGFRVLGASAAGTTAHVQGGAVVVPGRCTAVRIRVRRGVMPDLSFARTVRDYLANPGPWARPVAGLVPPPAGKPLDPARCDLLDLSAAATTDPFVAPFNVPGAATFAGLRPGVVTAAGVPFRILDPAANGGRGIAVLQGAQACSTLPRSVVIPVNRRARRAYFLGNVTGWNPGDPGAGPRGAVALYVVHYSDGKTQAVPLIAGRTCDDWLQAPGAAEAPVGLKGAGWHLNVLGVALRPVPVEAIEFRDLGTSASPLLAAVTLAR